MLNILARGLLDNASGAVVYVFLIGAHLAIPPAAVLKIVCFLQILPK